MFDLTKLCYLKSNMANMVAMDKGESKAILTAGINIRKSCAQ